MDIKTISNLGRFKDLIFILLKYGFEDLVDRLELPVKFIYGKKEDKHAILSTYHRIRLAFEELGPTFIKFGQIMSLRPDLVPPAFTEELSKLQDDVAPVKFKPIKLLIEKNLGGPLYDIFHHFDEKPFAAASLSQVYKAVLKENNRIVAVKVQRPGVHQKI